MKKKVSEHVTLAELIFMTTQQQQFILLQMLIGMFIQISAFQYFYR